MAPPLPDPPDGPGTTLALGPGEGTAAVSAGAEGDDPDARLVGRILAGRYLLERVIGRGGMGIVFEAKHVRVGRQVAVKVLRPALARVAEATARFHREAQAAAAVGSEHIVEVFDYGYGDDGEAFIVMELLEGEDLGALIRRAGPLPPGRAVAIARQIAGALQAAHDKGIIHRDLKSENVFVLARDGQDFVKVVDFGISKVQEIEPGSGPITHAGTVLGTPHYMAPEQGVGHIESDHRIDVYALGCLLYEMLTGSVPFTGRTAVEVMYKHVHEPVRPPSRVRTHAGISHALDAVVLRALAKDRDRRYPSTAAMAAALPDAATLTGGERARRSLPPPGWSGRALQRRGLPLLLAAAGALGALVVSRAWRRSPPVEAVRPARSVPASPPPAVPPPAVRPPSSTAQDAGVVVARSATVLTLLVRPDTASLRVDGQVVGTGDYTGRFPPGSVHRVAARAEGYAPREEEVALDGDRVLHWTLVRWPPVRPTLRPEAPAIAPVPAQGGTTPGTISPDLPVQRTIEGLDPNPYRDAST